MWAAALLSPPTCSFIYTDPVIHRPHRLFAPTSTHHPQDFLPLRWRMAVYANLVLVAALGLGIACVDSIVEAAGVAPSAEAEGVLQFSSHINSFVGFSLVWLSGVLGLLVLSRSIRTQDHQSHRTFHFPSVLPSYAVVLHEVRHASGYVEAMSLAALLSLLWAALAAVLLRPQGLGVGVGVGVQLACAEWILTALVEPLRTLGEAATLEQVVQNEDGTSAFRRIVDETLLVELLLQAATSQQGVGLHEATTSARAAAAAYETTRQALRLSSSCDSGALDVRIATAQALRDREIDLVRTHVQATQITARVQALVCARASLELNKQQVAASNCPFPLYLPLSHSKLNKQQVVCAAGVISGISDLRHVPYSLLIGISLHHS